MDTAILATLLFPAMMCLIAGVMLWTFAAAVRRDVTPDGRSSVVRLGKTVTGILIVSGAIVVLPALGIAASLNPNNPMRNHEAGVAAMILLILSAAALFCVSLFTWRFSTVLSDIDDELELDTRWSRFELWLRFFFFGPLVLGVGKIKSIEHGTAVAGALGWWLALWSALMSLVAGIALPVLLLISVICLIGLLMVAVAAQIVSMWGRWVHERHWTLWQIYLAIRSRRPLDDEFELLSRYAWGKRRRQLRDMCEEVEEGLEPDDIFVHPTLISSLEGAQIATGLKAGKLPEVLGDLVKRQADFADRISRTQNPIVGAVYLWAQLLVFWGVVSFIMYWIMPKFKKIFDDFGIELPAATVRLIQMSDFYVINYWYIGFPALVLVGAAMTLLMLVPFVTGDSRFREWGAWFWPRICLPDILRSLAWAVESKIPLEEALMPFVRRQLRLPLHSRLVRVQEAVRDGHDCWDEMVRRRLLTRREATLLQAAQDAGNLPWALKALSERREQRWLFKWLFAAEFLQPLVILLLSLMVGFFAVAMFMPLVQILMTESKEQLLR